MKANDAMFDEAGVHTLPFTCLNKAIILELCNRVFFNLYEE